MDFSVHHRPNTKNIVTILNEYVRQESKHKESYSTPDTGKGYDTNLNLAYKSTKNYT